MIQPLRELVPSFKQVTLDFPVHQGFFLIGCSATNFGGKLVASAWASDHIYNPAKARYENYVAPPGTPFLPGTVLSDRPPYLVFLGDDLSVMSYLPIVIGQSDNREMESIRTSRGGFDGLKPFEWRGELWCDFYAGGQGGVKFFMGRLDGSTLVDCRRLVAAGPRRDEKNWMPEVLDDELIYHYDVNTVARPGPVHVTLREMGRPDFKNLHGGTQVVDGLAIVHDFHYEGAGRVYRHYFVRFDHGGNPVALSRPFVLYDVERVEVVCGLAEHPDGEHLVISHGPCVATMLRSEVDNLPWDGIPQPATPLRRPPPSPLRIRERPPKKILARQGVRA